MTSDSHTRFRDFRPDVDGFQGMAPDVGVSDEVSVRVASVSNDLLVIDATEKRKVGDDKTSMKKEKKAHSH
jgi:hypothetical protein